MARHIDRATPASVNALQRIPTLPAVATDAATATLPAVATDPATATDPAVATDPATAMLPAVAELPTTATLPAVASDPASARESTAVPVRRNRVITFSLIVTLTVPLAV